MRKVCLLLAYLLLTVPVPVLAQGAVQPSAGSTLGLGFSPSSIVPLSQGIPVYTTGDQLWVESYADGVVSVVLVPPSGTGNLVASRLNPFSPTLLYTFSAADTPGKWNLSVPETGGEKTSITLVQGPRVDIRLESFTLDQTNASYSFSVSPSAGYDVVACLEGSQAEGAAVIPSANDAGADVVVSRDNGNFTEGLAGTVAKPFEFWFELHQGYGYSVPGTPGITLRDVLVGQANSQEFDVNTTAPSSATVVWYAPPREGRFELRAFVRTGSGLYVYSLPVFLTPGGGMVWVKSCSSTQSAVSSSLTLSAPVSVDPVKWARNVYLLYRYEGIEEITSDSLSVGLAGVEALASPWNQPFTNSTITVTGNSPVIGSVLINGALYVAANITAFPLAATIRLSTPGGETSASVVIASPFSILSVSIPAGELSFVLHGGGSASNGTKLKLTGKGGTLRLDNAPVRGVFYLLPGTYNLTATNGGVSRSATVEVNASGLETEAFDMAPQIQGLTVILYVLGVAVVAGVALNVWLWIVRPRRTQ